MKKKIKNKKNIETKVIKKINSKVLALKEMIRARMIDEKAITLYKQNKCHFQIGCAGHEAVGVAFANAMKPGYDWFFPYYRDMAFCCGLGMKNEEFFLNILSKEEDPNSGGRQMAMHYGHKDLNIVSQSSPTGTQFLQAVGAAMGVKYSGGDQVVFVSSGEGTTAQGAYHEALNWAAREKLPIIFLIENNHFAISVHISEHIAGSSIESISSGYNGLEVVSLNGLDYDASLKVANKAVNRARKGLGPTVVVAEVIRLQSHSISDNQSKYRKKSEIEAEKKKDPIEIFEKKLIKEKIISKKDLLKLKEDLKVEIDLASELSEKAKDPSAEDVLSYVLSENYSNNHLINEEELIEGESEFLVDSLNKALHEEMKLNEKMVVYGQDVGYGKGGVFSVTSGLTDKFGPKRCFNSPLAEDSICGTAVGLATVGYKPVVEIQFADYIWPGMMQIRNELAAMLYRSNGNFSCPAVIRVAVGGYIRGGLYHSQNIEATFSHFPGLVIIYPSNATDGKALLKSAIRSKDPVLFLEHKGLYRQVFAKGITGGTDHILPIGKAKVVRSGQDITIVTWGALVHRSKTVAEKIFEDTGKSTEVIDLRTITPLDINTIVESVKKTNRILVVHEDNEFMGFGAEIVSQIIDKAFNYLDAPIKRLGAKFSMVPQAPNLESEVLPQVEDIERSVLEVLNY